MRIHFPLPNPSHESFPCDSREVCSSPYPTCSISYPPPGPISEGSSLTDQVASVGIFIVNLNKHRIFTHVLLLILKGYNPYFPIFHSVSYTGQWKLAAPVFLIITPTITPICYLELTPEVVKPIPSGRLMSPMYPNVGGKVCFCYSRPLLSLHMAHCPNWREL